MTCANDPDDDIIEFSPESPDAVAILEEDPPPIIIHVCSLCLRMYDLIEDLRGHMMVYHGYRPIEEAVPRVSVNSRPVSVDAVQAAPTESINAEVPPQQEEMKPMPFKDFRIVLRMHMQLRCPVHTNCLYKFENQGKLDLHIKCHKNAPSTGFSCYECGMDMTNWRRCSVHLWKMHQVDVDLLQCPSCDYKSPVSVHIWRHMRVHKKWRPRVLRSLRAVMRKRQQNQQKTKAAVTAVVTAPPRPNKNKYYSEKVCDICSRTFVNGKTLSKHVKTVHNKIKPFICSVCGKKTARKASLIIHMRQHTGEKPLQCKSCKFSTRDPSVLHKHKMRHEKQDKLTCSQCAYTCIQANAYKRHMRLNHPEEYRKIACDLCNFSTINPVKLHAHKEDHRKGLLTNCEDSMDASRTGSFKYPRKLNDKNNEISADCFMPLESIDSLPHEPAVDTGGVTIPAPSEDTQFPTYLNN